MDLHILEVTLRVASGLPDCGEDELDLNGVIQHVGDYITRLVNTNILYHQEIQYLRNLHHGKASKEIN